jgi:transcription elongation factor GreA
MPDPAYLSHAGEAEVRAELDELIRVERPAVVARIVAARELGDLSENADYEIARKEQSILEGRIEHLTALIKNAVVFEETRSDHVTLGSTVTLVGGDGEETYTIVGSTEAKPAQGRISSTSPMGKGLMGRRVGDVVSVTAPGGTFKVEITAVA